MKKLAAILLLTLLTGAAMAQSLPPIKSASDLSAYVNHLTDVQVEFTKMIPPGWSIQVKEVSREGSVTQYHVFIQGAPEGWIFQEISWPVTQDEPSVAMEGITIGKDGILICDGRNALECGDASRPDDPIEFTFQSLKGEANRIAFKSQNVTIGTVIVPDPVEGKNKGCTLSAVRLTAGFELAYVEGAGYQPNSDIHYLATSDKPYPAIIHSDDKGVIRFSVLAHPANVGQKDGKIKVKIMESQCSPELSYEWGQP
jgi:hypothetical protein